MLKVIFRALRHRNYRLYFAGQGTSLIGTWFTIVATSWLVYSLTLKSDAASAPLILGISSFCTQLPVLLFSAVGGVLVDRWNRQHILYATQVLSMLQSTALAVLSLLGIITIPEVLALNALQGIVNAFDIPARQAFLVDIVQDREDMPNAIALNSSMFNGARLIGPAIAGQIISRLAIGYCFAIDAASYLAVLLALFAMKVPQRQNHSAPAQPGRQRGSFQKEVRGELLAGLKYAFKSPGILSVLFFAGTVSFAIMPLQVLIPIFADKLSAVPREAPTILGYLTAASGVGALAGSIYLASRKSVVGLGRVMALSALLLGTALIAFALSQSLAYSLPCMFASGFGMIAVMASSNTVVQTIVDDNMRGRVMSFFGMAVMGTTPFGSLLAGKLAQRYGERGTLMMCGGLCMLSGIVFAFRLPALRNLIRPIYVNKGIVEE